MVFKKTYGALKSFVRNSSEKFTKGMKLLGPQVLNFSQKGLGLLATVPGAVGTVARTANAGIGMLKNIIDKVPNEKVKASLSNMINTGSDIVNSAAANAVSKATKLHDATASWSKFATDTSNIISKGVT
jgi:hypothetical protein